MTCTWEPDPACLGDEWAALTPEVQERSLLLATSSLQMLTYNRVGACPVTIRPCPSTPRCGCGFDPHICNGVWVNRCCHDTPCAPLSEIDLPGPVGFIDEFKIDGQAVDFTTLDPVTGQPQWSLHEGHLLVWQGSGPSPVPSYQNLNLPDSEPGTWSITYSRSYPVLEDGRIAVAYLAMEFAKACKPKGKCSLPKGVQSVARNGVSFTIEAGLYPGGLTGIEIVDAYILKWAPAGSPTKTAQVLDPGKRAPRRTNSVPLRSPAGSL